jgi:hypothetical protein
MSVQDTVYSQSSCCNILKHEIHAKSKYSYLPGYINSLTKTNLLMMFTTVFVWSDNCTVPIFSSHTSGMHKSQVPRCWVFCLCIEVTDRDVYSSIWMG